MKKLFLVLTTILIINISVFSQEALKSIEEEYYDFLSLTGVVERPTLGYRTLSDGVWAFNEIESFEENEDGSFTKVRTPGEESPAHIWKNNNLGTTYTLWSASSPANNWFANGLKQGLTAHIYGPEWFNSYNTAVPYGQNDGALWQGRGYNTSLTAGIRLEGYGFELTFKPQVSFSQNLDFPILTGVYDSPYSYYTNAGGGIDLVQRYGDKPFFNFDLADSEIRWSWKSFTLGFGTQNPWLGLSYLNPMMGSNNAAGYPKFDIGLRKTQLIIPGTGLNVGTIEGRIWLGKLDHSDYFLTSYPYSTMINGMTVSYMPSFIPGLTLGANRIFLTRWNPNNLKYIFRLFTFSQSNDVDGDGEDQKVSIFANWLFAKIGFEVYFEYGFDDFSRLWVNPFHTGIYTVGIKQAIPMKSENLKSELIIEFNNFEMSQDFQLQWCYTGFYSHSKILSGYTNKGQSLGTNSGLFGNSQYIAYKLYYKKGSTTIYGHRFCPDNNYIYNMAVNAAATSGTEISSNYYAQYITYTSGGISSQYFITKDLSFYANLTFTYIANYMYEKYKDEINFNGSLLLKYQF